MHLLNSLFEINLCNCESDIFFFDSEKVFASFPTVYLNTHSEEFVAFLIDSRITAETSCGNGAFFSTLNNNDIEMYPQYE